MSTSYFRYPRRKRRRITSSSSSSSSSSSTSPIVRSEQTSCWLSLPVGVWGRTVSFLHGEFEALLLLRTCSWFDDPTKEQQLLKPGFRLRQIYSVSEIQWVTCRYKKYITQIAALFVTVFVTGWAWFQHTRLPYLEMIRLGLPNDKAAHGIMTNIKLHSLEVKEMRLHLPSKIHMFHWHLLPSSLITLSLYGCADNIETEGIPVGALPPSLQSLSISCTLFIPLASGSLPNGLIRLDLRGSAYNHPLPSGLLPPTLQQLFLGDAFIQPIEMGILPDSLLELNFGWWYNQSLPILPSKLEILWLGEFFRQEIPKGILPDSLKTIRVPSQDTVRYLSIYGHIPPDCVLIVS